MEITAWDRVYLYRLRREMRSNVRSCWCGSLCAMSSSNYIQLSVCDFPGVFYLPALLPCVCRVADCVPVSPQGRAPGRRCRVPCCRGSAALWTACWTTWSATGRPTGTRSSAASARDTTAWRSRRSSSISVRAGLLRVRPAPPPPSPGGPDSM